MLVRRIFVLAVAAGGLFAAAPASAQFFLKPANLSGARVTGTEPGIVVQELPGATGEELRSALIWNLRAALNVAALQCQFAPTLLTLNNYNAILRDHKVELAESYQALEKYFVRVNGGAKNKKAGQTELDRYGTRVYQAYATVSSQYSFCETADAIGHDALYVRRGRLGDLAHERMRELRNSLSPWGEQAFNRQSMIRGLPAERMPPFQNETCWKKSRYVEKKCGPLAPHWGSVATASSR